MSAPIINSPTSFSPIESPMQTNTIARLIVVARTSPDCPDMCKSKPTWERSSMLFTFSPASVERKVTTTIIIHVRRSTCAGVRGNIISHERGYYTYTSQPQRLWCVLLLSILSALCFLLSIPAILPIHKTPLSAMQD